MYLAIRQMLAWLSIAMNSLCSWLMSKPIPASSARVIVFVASEPLELRHKYSLASLFRPPRIIIGAGVCDVIHVLCNIGEAGKNPQYIVDSFAAICANFDQR